MSNPPDTTQYDIEWFQHSIVIPVNEFCPVVVGFTVPTPRSGDGPINEYPWGSVAPVRDPYPDCRHHEPIMVDLDELNLKLALTMTRRQANDDKDR